jgi:hypothetical protein
MCYQNKLRQNLVSAMCYGYFLLLAYIYIAELMVKQKKIPLQTWRKWLLQFVGFLNVKHTECVKVLGTSDLELNHILAPLDSHWPRILPSSSEKEILNLVDLLRLCTAPNTLSEQLAYKYYINKDTSSTTN